MSPLTGKAGAPGLLPPWSQGILGIGGRGFLSILRNIKAITVDLNLRFRMLGHIARLLVTAAIVHRRGPGAIAAVFRHNIGRCRQMSKRRDSRQAGTPGSPETTSTVIGPFGSFLRLWTSAAPRLPAGSQQG